MGEMLNILKDDTGSVVNKMMELSTARQKILSQNLANSNTPDYIRKDVKFNRQLEDALKSGSTRAEIKNLTPKVYEDLKNAPRKDGNNVKASEELSQLMQNSLEHRLLTRARQTRGNILKMAIKGPK